MKANTEEFLYFLLWGASILTRPTYSNFNSSFEQWAYRSGFGRRLQVLKQQKLIEAQGLDQPDSINERIVKLTSAGRISALGGIDPELRWTRPWDGQWRLVFFDVPENHRKQRSQLRRTLKDLKFGYLQNSVWLSPDPLTEHSHILSGARINTEALTLFEGRPAGGESDKDLVNGAWNFVKVRQRYEAWMKVAAQAPMRPRQTTNWNILRQWAQREREAWATILECDPFLPAPLLPTHYLGQKCWAQRVSLLSGLTTHLNPHS